MNTYNVQPSAPPLPRGTVSPYNPNPYFQPYRPLNNENNNLIYYPYFSHNNVILPSQQQQTILQPSDIVINNRNIQNTECCLSGCLSTLFCCFLMGQVE